MLKLRFFGGLAVDQSSAGAKDAMRGARRLALLAVIPIGRQRSVSRDKLLAMFWPESDAEHARGALSQALYTLRQDLEMDDLFLGTTALSLNPDVVESDVDAFDRAVDSGTWSDAVGLYAGPFLDGFHLSDAPEFEHWVDGERARLEQLHRSALESLAEEATTAGRHRDAVGWWRRLAATDPLSTHVTLRLMEALARAGDRAGALQVARAHETLLHEELEATPSAAVRDLAERLRSRAGEAPPPARAAPPPRPAEKAKAAAEPEGARGAVKGATQSGALQQGAASGAAPQPTLPAWEQESLVANRFLIKRELGRGAIASVFLARDQRHDRLVALKLVARNISDVVSTARFQREIAIVARLQHPHIVPLYESDETEGSLYYVMPYIEGSTLRDRLEREQRLEIEESVRIAFEIAGALAYAHGQGVVHRDIKPANILLADEHVMISDFGIARALSEAGGRRLTDSGFTVGTPVYMSPEQACGDPVDARSDQFSLACVLFEMLTGRPPFMGENTRAAMADRFLGPPPSLAQLRDGVSAELQGVVERALAIAPAERYPTVAAFAGALRSGPLRSGARSSESSEEKRWWRSFGI